MHTPGFLLMRNPPAFPAGVYSLAGAS